MRLALLGYPISHSLSPKIYRDILGDTLESYELLEIKDKNEIPSLKTLAEKLDGLSITAPHKRHFISEVTVTSPGVQKLGFINALSFNDGKVFGTNTDFLAAQEILERFQIQYPNLSLIILGSGAMSELAEVLATQLKINFVRLSRNQGLELTQINLNSYYQPHEQTIVINTCARSFIYQGELHPSFIFWDFNYQFLPHQNTLPSKVMSYVDGQEMLHLQARAALKFWKETNPKLKC